MDQYTKYQFIDLVRRIDDASAVMAMAYKCGHVASQALEEYKKAWGDLENLLDLEIKRSK